MAHQTTTESRTVAEDHMDKDKAAVVSPIPDAALPARLVEQPQRSVAVRIAGINMPTHQPIAAESPFTTRWELCPERCTLSSAGKCPLCRQGAARCTGSGCISSMMKWSPLHSGSPQRQRNTLAGSRQGMVAHVLPGVLTESLLGFLTVSAKQHTAVDEQRRSRR